MAASDTLIVIPARIGSTRLKDKPLRAIDGRALITHVCYRALEADVGPVILCSDDELVLQAAPRGVRAIYVKTGPWEHCGSDRVAYVSESLGDPCPHVINLQGDLPFIDPQVIRAVAASRRVSKADLVTACCRCMGVGTEHHARFYRFDYEVHVGIYGFTADSLERFTSAPQTDAEKRLNLEGLRAPWPWTWDYVTVDHMPLEINTEADLKHANLIAQCIWRDADAGVSD